MLEVVTKQGEHNEILKVSGNYLQDMECYEVEIIKNDTPCDTLFRIELADNDYLNITMSELRTLKAILNSHEVSRILDK
jgi:hypothetical protein